MIKLRLSYCAILLLCFWGTSFGQNDVLVIDYNNSFTSDQFTNNSRIYNRLVATNTSVTRIASIPGVINTFYQECWIFGDMGAPVAANLNPVVNYINAGGAVYIQSEVNCCNNQAAFTDSIINLVVTVGGLITHRDTMIGGDYRFVADPEVYCAAWPNTHGVVVRTYPGTPPGNVLFRGTNVCGGAITTNDIIGVRFSACDMISGNGALMSMGDFNTFPSGSCSGGGIVGDPNDLVIIDLISTLFDELLICSPCGAPLPIELLSFTGESRGNTNVLEWSTASETNNSMFTIERTTDGVNFISIAEVNGAGNSNVQLNYIAVDGKPSEGINYYRLKQTDFDGVFSYSQLIAVNSNPEFALTLYPNPTRDRLTLSVPNNLENPVFKIFNPQGVIVKEKKVEGKSKRLEINVSDLGPGLYYLHVLTSDKRIVRSFVKE